MPKAIGFVYSPLWKITHQDPSVLCTPPFEKSLFLVGAILQRKNGEILLVDNFVAAEIDK